ncbi:MAG: rod shape-determining protein MreD [Desulfuromonas sp.]|nr:rod shape-determining protein MreD [Desulfuromonas sp.]
MIRLIRYLTTGIILIVLQTAVLPHFLGMHFRPDLLLILVLYSSLSNVSPCSGAFYAWGLGCLFDVFSGTTLGLYGIVMLIIFCASASTGRQFNRDNNITMIIATIVGTIAQSALIAFMLLCFANTTQSWLPIIKQLPTQLLINLGTIILITVLKQPVVEITQQQKLHRNQRSQSSWG